jgi:hypothetical protein
MTNPTTPRPAPFISVNASPAMSGHFATLYQYSAGEGGTDIYGKAYAPYWFAEPCDSGCGRYPTIEGANAEGAAWAAEIGVAFRPATAEDVEKAAAASVAMRARAAAMRAHRDAGMGLKEAAIAAGVIAA